jgi:excisionase family DNA binding protein
MTEKYLPPKEAAERYGVSLKTIQRWIAEGRIEAYRFGPRLVRIKPESIESLGKAIHPNFGGDVL